VLTPLLLKVARRYDGFRLPKVTTVGAEGSHA